MIDPTDPVIASHTRRAFEQLITNNADRRAHVVAELTAFSFLIENGHATHDQITQRLHLVQRSMPVNYQSADVTGRLTLLVDALAGAYGPKKRGWTPTVIQGGLDHDQTIDPNPPVKQD
jgi:hypothetical protein